MDLRSTKISPSSDIELNVDLVTLSLTLALSLKAAKRVVLFSNVLWWLTILFIVAWVGLNGVVSLLSLLLVYIIILLLRLCRGEQPDARKVVTFIIDGPKKVRCRLSLVARTFN
jgi:hypothetical protein